MRLSLLGEVITMALQNIRVNRMRSALTVLGVVIGVSSIVGMTSLIRGFDESLRGMIAAVGPDTIFVQRIGISSFSGPGEMMELMKRPNLSVADATAIEREAAETIQLVDLELGAAGPPTLRRVSFGDKGTKPLVIMGTSEHFAEGTRLPVIAGRFFNGTELQYRHNVAVIGHGPWEALFGIIGTDPIGKFIRVGSDRFRIVGVFDKRPSAGGFNMGVDDFVVIPHTAYSRVFGLKANSFGGRGGGRGPAGGAAFLPIQIALVPRDGVSQKAAIADVERVMRIRHGLKLDDPNDFDIMTQDSILGLWDTISAGTFLALIVISSIALMVGGIGVMAIMMISVTDRTREIGIRKALGARRSEILFQFLTEAVTVTSLGGILGIAFGSAIGVAVHLASGFPISLPWWSFAIGLSFSAAVGIFFGMYPAIKASRLDPIEALRYE
jgi:putative ABC transport system permease protein